MGLYSAPQQPADRDYGKEMEKTLLAQIEAQKGTGAFEDVGPMVEVEEEFRPRWTQLELDTLKQIAPELMGIYEKDIAPKLSSIEADSYRKQREADLTTVEDLGGRATEALLGADPRKKAISDLLMQQAQEELEAGASLDPSLRREVQQSYRQGATARGMAYNPSSAAEEAYFTGVRAEELRRRRQQAAMGILGQRQQLTGDPFMQILGRPSAVAGQMGGFGGQGLGIGSSSGPRVINPESQYAADVYGTNYQGALATEAAGAQMRGAMVGGLASGLGSLGGGFLAGR